MRTLPDNPDLDHLRRQAKDLLAGLRDSTPGASLGDAQAALAEQYGFRGWTDLKAEVERRRGQAEVADPGIARAVAARYGLGEVTGPMRSLARPDAIGRQWSLPTDRGRFAVRTLDTWIPIVDAETDVALQQAAARAGVRLPAPVRSRSGAIVESVGGHRWRVYEWCHSGPPLAAPVSAAVTYQVGGILARVHRLALPVDRVSPWHASRLSPTSWAELATEARTRGAAWAGALAEMVPALADLDMIGEQEPSGTPVLCHNTLGPASVRLGEGGRLVVFDWEHAGGQPPAWELGDALMHWTADPRGGVNAAGARAMLEGYRSEGGGLPPPDLAMFSGAATSVANHLLEEMQRAWNPVYEQDRRYADRSVRHLLSHLPTRSAFEDLLDALAAVGS